MKPLVKSALDRGLARYRAIKDAEFEAAREFRKRHPSVDDDNPQEADIDPVLGDTVHSLMKANVEPNGSGSRKSGRKKPLCFGACPRCQKPQPMTCALAAGHKSPHVCANCRLYATAIEGLNDRPTTSLRFRISGLSDDERGVFLGSGGADTARRQLRRVVSEMQKPGFGQVHLFIQLLKLFTQAEPRRSKRRAKNGQSDLVVYGLDKGEIDALNAHPGLARRILSGYAKHSAQQAAPSPVFTEKQNNAILAVGEVAPVVL